MLVAAFGATHGEHLGFAYQTIPRTGTSITIEAPFGDYRPLSYWGTTLSGEMVVSAITQEGVPYVKHIRSSISTGAVVPDIAVVLHTEVVDATRDSADVVVDRRPMPEHGIELDVFAFQPAFKGPAIYDAATAKVSWKGGSGDSAASVLGFETTTGSMLLVTPWIGHGAYVPKLPPDLGTITSTVVDATVARAGEYRETVNTLGRRFHKSAMFTIHLTENRSSGR